MREKPIIFNTEMVQAILDGRKTMTRRVIKSKVLQQWIDVGFSDEFIKLPENNWANESAYQPGDVLWVRETWQRLKIEKPINAVPDDYKPIQYVYKADDDMSNSDGTDFKWRPSIHMPRTAARIFLTVKEVSVERLIDISDSDVVNEGFQTKNDFFALWDKLNYHRGFGVANNPFVWKIEFERVIRQNGGQD